MITVRREGEGYLARASSPHIRRTMFGLFPGSWANATPMSDVAVVRSLCARGAHVQDAWDAVHAANASPTGEASI